MRRGAAQFAATLALGVAVAVAPGAVGATADACTESARAVSARRVESPRYVLVFVPAPAPIAVGQHFSVDAVVCARDGARPATGLRVDALMPEHRHGMNYRATVSARGDGRFLAEGLLFHMPGRWQLVFDVEAGGGSDRIVADVPLQ
jgi:hypothetical protein